MPKLPTPKFKIGQKVKEKGLLNSEGGAIVKVIYDSDVGFSYAFKSKEVDVKLKKIIRGQKVCPEKELEVFDESK
jgi:hypothetical protein